MCSRVPNELVTTQVSGYEASHVLGSDCLMSLAGVNLYPERWVELEVGGESQVDVEAVGCHVASDAFPTPK